MAATPQNPNELRFDFRNPNFRNLGQHIALNARWEHPMVEPDSHADARGAAICAPGPTLLQPSSTRELRNLARKKWHIFAIKEAISFLTERNIGVHYSVAMDPDAAQVDKTPIVPGVTYCVASSCHPALFQHLSGQQIRVFHSVNGWRGQGHDENGVLQQIGERHLYYYFYNKHVDTIVGGFSVVNRAIGLAYYMGFRKITVFGAPFGWRQNSDYYAKGSNALPSNTGKDLTDNGVIDGKPWFTRPDMLASAVAVAQNIRNGHVSVVGDSLAASIAVLTPEKLKYLFPRLRDHRSATHVRIPEDPIQDSPPEAMALAELAPSVSQPAAQ